MICAADKIHNLSSATNAYRKLGEKSLERFNAPIKEKIWLYGEALKILKRRLENNIVIELENKYREAKKLFNLT